MELTTVGLSTLDGPGRSLYGAKMHASGAHYVLAVLVCMVPATHGAPGDMLAASDFRQQAWRSVVASCRGSVQRPAYLRVCLAFSGRVYDTAKASTSTEECCGCDWLY